MLMLARSEEDANDFSRQNAASSTGAGLPPRRVAVSAACESCRQKKAKCDGERPRCARCARLDAACVYGTRAGETRATALRRRSRSLGDEVAHLRALFEFIRVRPEAEALEVVRRIRAAGPGDAGPLAVRLPPPPAPVVSGAEGGDGGGEGDVDRGEPEPP
ncbi:hypothetical protein GGR56DRAFT_685464 [Xylariaceae sp. FL0804]|nr:hypothetical protein GGR56DRAFT_685464 [Xylariaceae sp. FL0804]